MAVTTDADGFRYSSSRPGAEFSAKYAPSSDPYLASPGSLEHWLTERYCLYAAAPEGSIWRNDVHHHPWPLQAARASIDRNTMFEFHGLEIREAPALLHFAKRIDVVVWNAERVG